MSSVYLFITIVSFFALGIILFIKHASKMSKKYFFMTLIMGMLSISFFLAGFINPRLGFLGIFFAYFGGSFIHFSC